uniref:Uncharacterized protein n=1 Tax=viral metagenome TaxID=1070528 RepID=A0A6C0H9E1_9ZZZZ
MNTIDLFKEIYFYNPLLQNTKTIICYYEFKYGKCLNISCPYTHITNINYLTILEYFVNSNGETIYFIIKNKIVNIRPYISYIQLILYGFKLYKIDQNILKAYNIFTNAFNIFIKSTNNQYFNYPLYYDLIYIIDKIQNHYNYMLYINELKLQINSISKNTLTKYINRHIKDSIIDIIQDEVFVHTIYNNIFWENNILLNKKINWADCNSSDEE